MKRYPFVLILVVFLILASMGNASASGPRIVPNTGSLYAEQAAKWWQWAYSFPADKVPFLNTGGAVDLAAGQSGHIWFLAGANLGLPQGPRTGVIPANTYLFFPMANYIDDYPCPDPNFHPAPGETLEHFLQTDATNTMNYVLPHPSKELLATLDGVPLADKLAEYRATSKLFYFKSTTAVGTAVGDACITGHLQPGVADGYWLMLEPLRPGTHTLHFEAHSPSVDTFQQVVTYKLTVLP
jgi:hypothetical protein